MSTCTQKPSPTHGRHWATLLPNCASRSQSYTQKKIRPARDLSSEMPKYPAAAFTLEHCPTSLLSLITRNGPMRLTSRRSRSLAPRSATQSLRSSLKLAATHARLTGVLLDGIGEQA